MNREEATDKLRRMVAVIQSGELPATILGLYVFGSFSRGALSPGDLDIILHYSNPDKTALAECRRLTRRNARNIVDQVSDGILRFERLLTKRLRKPGEKIDLMATRDLDSTFRTLSDVPRREFRLVWSSEANDVEANMAAIPLDPSAGRAERHQFISPKRIGSDRESVDQMTKMLDDRELKLTRIDSASLAPDLRGHYRHWYDWWTEIKCLGRDTQKCLPFGIWWMQQQEAGEIHLHGTVIWNEKRTRRVQLGRVNLHQVGWCFGHLPKLKLQCLIPQIKRHERNELLIFERGPNWKTSDYADIEPWSPESPGL